MGCFVQTEETWIRRQREKQGHALHEEHLCYREECEIQTRHRRSTIRLLVVARCWIILENLVFCPPLRSCFPELLERNIDFQNSLSTLRSFPVEIAYFFENRSIELFSLIVERVSPRLWRVIIKGRVLINRYSRSMERADPSRCTRKKDILASIG